MMSGVQPFIPRATIIRVAGRIFKSDK